jgi:protein-tyrosine-phosphatase
VHYVSHGTKAAEIDMASASTLITETAADYAARQPTKFEAAANAKAAAIAAGEVRAHICRTGSERHRQSLAAYEAGERSWPWPDPTRAEQAKTDAEFAQLSKQFVRMAGGAK